jgi:hypothetical protein
MLSLSYSRRVNDFGVCSFVVNSQNLYAAEILKNRIVEVWRKPHNLTVPYKEDTYIIRAIRNEFNGANNQMTVMCLSGNWLLATRVVAWKAGTSGKATFSAYKAETLAKDLVKYNLGSSATTGNGRIVDGTHSLVTVQTDAATGGTISINCAYENLLATLQSVSDLGAGDFAMYWTGSAWDFRWYNGQLGTDRSSSLLFALERSNIEYPSSIDDYTSEKTLAIIGGQGEEAERNVRTKQSATYAADNKIEMFVDARDVTAGATDENTQLDARGDAALLEAAAINDLQFSIVQTVNSYYGTDYFLGDLARVLYAGRTRTVKISEVVIEFAEGQDEKVTIGVSDE